MNVLFRRGFFSLISAVMCVMFFFDVSFAYNGYPHPDRSFIPSQSDMVFIADLQRRTFDGFMKKTGHGDQFFIENDDDKDRAGQGGICTACLGFQLAAYVIGAERHYITRTHAQMSTLTILRALKALPQNDSLYEGAGYKGFFYSYLDPKTGLRAHVEGNGLSPRDNSFLMLGILLVQHYYRQDIAADEEIRRIANALFERVQWPFFLRDDHLLSQQWTPSHGFNAQALEGYNEGMAAYILAMGSPSYPVDSGAWKAWQHTIEGNWQIVQGESYFNAVPLASHLLAQAWIDFHGIDDAENRLHHMDYAENTTRAVRAEKSYGMHNPMGWKNYNDMLWGLTTSDGPGERQVPYNGTVRAIMGHAVRGISHAIIVDDGTVSPAIEAASLPFAPQTILSSLHGLHAYYGRRLDGDTGLVSAFNASVDSEHADTQHGGWISQAWHADQQGLSLLMMANWRDRTIWNVMKTSPVICRGLMKAEFRGGWLARHHLSVDYDDARRRQHG